MKTGEPLERPTYARQFPGGRAMSMSPRTLSMVGRPLFSRAMKSAPDASAKTLVPTTGCLATLLLRLW
eukprot:8210139-Lingulodinium_polyedra.AAC.1